LKSKNFNRKGRKGEIDFRFSDDGRFPCDVGDFSLVVSFSFLSALIRVNPR